MITINNQISLFKADNKADVKDPVIIRGNAQIAGTAFNISLWKREKENKTFLAGQVQQKIGDNYENVGNVVCFKAKEGASHKYEIIIEIAGLSYNANLFAKTSQSGMTYWSGIAKLRTFEETNTSDEEMF